MLDISQVTLFIAVYFNMLYFIMMCLFEEQQNHIARKLLPEVWIPRCGIPVEIQSYLTYSKPIAAILSGEGAAIVQEANAGFAVKRVMQRL